MATSVLQSLILGKQWNDLVCYLNTDKGRKELIRSHDDEEYKPLHTILDVDAQAPLCVIKAILQVFPDEPARSYTGRDVWYGSRGKNYRFSVFQYAIKSLQHKNPVPMSSIIEMLKSCPRSATLDCPRDGIPIIHLAAENDMSDNGELVRAILETIPHLAHLRTIRSIYRVREESPLSVACRNGNKGAIEALLEAESGASFKSNGNLPLHLALSSGLCVIDPTWGGSRPKVIQRLLDAYPCDIFHRNRCGQCPCHVLLDNAEIKKFRYGSVWIPLLNHTYNQIYNNCISFCSKNCGNIKKNNYKNCENVKNNITFKDASSSSLLIPPTMWHAINLMASLLTVSEYASLLSMEFQVVKKYKDKYKNANLIVIKELEEKKCGNTLLHLLFLSFTEPVLGLTTKPSIVSQDNSKDEEEDNIDENENTLIDADFWEEDNNTSHFEQLIKYLDDVPLMVGQMTKHYNNNGELPLHILLKQPCQEVVHGQQSIRNNNWKGATICMKYNDMCRLIEYNPSAVSEREHSKLGLLPFMIAAVNFNSSDNTNDETQCTQCLSCIYDLLRSAGVDSCHNAGYPCSEMDFTSMKKIVSSDQHNTKKRQRTN